MCVCVCVCVCVGAQYIMYVCIVKNDSDDDIANAPPGIGLTLDFDIDDEVRKLAFNPTLDREG